MLMGCEERHDILTLYKHPHGILIVPLIFPHTIIYLFTVIHIRMLITSFIYCHGLFMLLVI